MATQFTYRLIVVVRATRVAEANAAAHTVDPGGGDAFTAPLRFVTSPVTQRDVYLCSWQMRPSEAPALQQALRNAGFKPTEVGLVPVGSAPRTTDDLWVFDATDPATGWTADQVRLALGLAFVETVHG
jgi:hypothetical protein